MAFGFESRVERTIRVQSGNSVTSYAQNTCEVAADQNLTIRLNGDRVNVGTDGTGD